MLGLTEQLLYSTVRIEAWNANGVPSTGTGFFFNFPCPDDNEVIPAIVTNKHVIHKQTRGRFHLTMNDGRGRPDIGKHEGIELLDFGTCWIHHPDPRVDLAICPIAPVFHQLAHVGKRIFYVGLDQSLIPSEAQLSELNAVEDVMMVGYPNGLWDATNNLPLVRRGITSSPPSVQYNGKPEFVIDMACFPGSSGSPVLIVNQGLVQDKKGNINLGGSRILLLGILYAGPQTTASGRIVVTTAPTNLQPIPVVNMMMNLGFCVRAERIMDFAAILLANSAMGAQKKLLAASDAA
jgi:hypothetical protein